MGRSQSGERQSPGCKPSASARSWSRTGPIARLSRPRGTQEFVPVPEVLVPVDATAAGDGFNAGYLRPGFPAWPGASGGRRAPACRRCHPPSRCAGSARRRRDALIGCRVAGRQNLEHSPDNRPPQKKQPRLLLSSRRLTSPAGRDNPCNASSLRSPPFFALALGRARARRRTDHHQIQPCRDA